MKWKVEYLKEAIKDLKSLDQTQRYQAVKAIEKVSENPLPVSEGGYGKPLGNKSGMNLSGYFKIKIVKIGLRVVYAIVKQENIMRIIVIAARTDEEVYKKASDRLKIRS